MQKAEVYYNESLAGLLTKNRSDEYSFSYNVEYLANSSQPAISLTLPKRAEEYLSPVLFSFFAGLLTEGVNKDIQCRLLKIDEQDDFTRLLKTAGEDSIGAITVKEMIE